METSRSFDYTCLSSFCADYEFSQNTNKKERDGKHFNKVGPNKHIRGLKGTYRIPYWNRLG